MADRSTTHSAQVDDAMAADAEALTRGAPIESRTQESRMSEAQDDELEVEAIIDFASDPVPGSLGEAERRRSELAMALRPHSFPGERDQLLRVAEREQAPDWSSRHSSSCDRHALRHAAGRLERTGWEPRDPHLLGGTLVPSDLRAYLERGEDDLPTGQ